jgi:uncharacterized DUF497 family protein
VADLRCEWDPRKARENKRKHGVSFEEAETVFLDEHGLLLDDPDESKGEARFLLLGMSAVMRLLVVCHCERSGGSVLRIISARRANKAEQSDYWDKVTR